MRIAIGSALGLLVSATLTACGGGGGSNSGSADFLGGVYRGVLSQTANTCALASNHDEGVLWTVNQDPNRIVLESSTGTTYEGMPTGPDSFETKRTDTDQNGCVTETDAVVTKITASSANATVIIASACGGLACGFRYDGPATRSTS
jgi:hypothetical protein